MKRRAGVFEPIDNLEGFSITKNETREGTTHSLQTISNGKIIERNRSFKTTDSVLTPETEHRDWVKDENAPVSVNKSSTIAEDDVRLENLRPSSLNLSDENLKDPSPESEMIFGNTDTSSGSKIAIGDSSSDKADLSTDLSPKIEDTFLTTEKSSSVNENEINVDAKPNWFVVYGDGYHPVVLSPSQYEKFQEKLKDANKSKIDVAVQTFNSREGNSSIKIIYDQDNKFQYLSKNYQTPIVKECQISTESRDHATSWETLRQCRRSSREKVKFDRRCIELLDKIDKLKKRDECLRRVQKINCVGDDEEGAMVIDSDAIQSGIKIADLQCKLRDFEGEVHRLNEERLCLEMKCNQQKRCNKNLQTQLASSAKIEEELRCCLQRSETRIEQSQKCVRSKIAALVHKLENNCEISVAELMMEDFDTLQCLLEKTVDKVVRCNESYKRELQGVFCQVKDLEEKLCCSEKRSQIECLRVKNLKEKLLRYQDDMQSSVTDLGSRIRSSEQELNDSRVELKKLTKKCSHHEHLSKCKENVIKDLQEKLNGLEEERTRCVERLQSKHSCYKSRLKSLKEKYKERLRYLLDKQVQLCSAKNNASPEDEDKAEITLKKVEAICSEAICRMKEIQKTMKCNEQSDTELRERINEIKCSLEGVRNCSNNSGVEEALCLLGEKISDANKLADLLKIDRPCSPIKSLGFSSSERESNKKPGLSIQQEINRAQTWAANILSGQSTCCIQDNSVRFQDHNHCPFSDNQSIDALPICTIPLSGTCRICETRRNG